MITYSLDTDTITKLLKKHPGNLQVVERSRHANAFVMSSNGIHASSYVLSSTMNCGVD